MQEQTKNVKPNENWKKTLNHFVGYIETIVNINVQKNKMANVRQDKGLFEPPSRKHGENPHSNHAKSNICFLPLADHWR